MPVLHPVFRSRLGLGLFIALCLWLPGCTRNAAPQARLVGALLDGKLDETSGLAASRVHRDVLWLVEDGGNPAQLHAISKRGRHLASFKVDGVPATDWEDLAAFELDGTRYLLIADTGDNGGLRHTLLLHVLVEPEVLSDGATLSPAWSIAFRWPDGARDCEAVAVDAARGQILLVSKKRQPPQLFALPLHPALPGVQTARVLGTFDQAPGPDADELRQHPGSAPIRHQVTAADLSPDGRRLALLTYQQALLYTRKTDESWEQAIGRAPELRSLPWLHQAEALGWAADGLGLYATGEFSPSPLLYLPAELPSSR